MEIKQLKALRIIAELGSFSMAADSLRLTQSALSHQIRNLEQELGETLLIRGKPRVYASPAGEVVLRSTERILAEIGCIQEHFAQSRNGPVSGTLRVAASNSGMVYLYGDLCDVFMSRYPGIELAFRATETPEEAARRVEEGAADIAFVPFLSEHPMLESLPMGTTEDAFIVGHAHPLQRRKTVTLEQVRQHPFVRFHPGSGSRAVSDRLFLSGGGYPPIAAESNDMEFVKRIVAMGAGVALIPVMALGREARARTLRVLRLNDRTLAAPFGMVHRKGVRLKTIETMKSFCLEIRGAQLRHLTIENIGRPVFGAAPTAAG